MDKDACLKEMVELAASIRASYEDESGNGVDQEDANRLAELVESLDSWIRRGGGLPIKWLR